MGIENRFTGFTLYQAACIGDPRNCYYPKEFRVTDEESLKLAVRKDYVCAMYKNGYRSNANFVGTDCVAMDMDNDHSDDPGEWITPEYIRKVFPDVTLAIHYSRNNMKAKKERSARPRFHVFMACQHIDDAEMYRALKERVQRVLPYFDTNAKDAARFFFGTEESDVKFWPGTISIEECLNMYYQEGDDGMDSLELMQPIGSFNITIPEGQRNATMSMFAGRLLKRLGPTDEAYASYLERASICSPPLDQKELDQIWRSALGFYARVSEQIGYLSPEQYENNKNRKYDPDDRTDVGQAELLRDLMGTRMRYSSELGFLGYNGVYWEKSEQLAKAEAQKLTELQLMEARAEKEKAWEKCKEVGVEELLANAKSKSCRTVEKTMNAEQAKAYEEWQYAGKYYEWAENRRSSRNIKATIEQITPMILIGMKQLDADHLLINCPDHSYDLRKGSEGGREHRPEDYCTMTTSVEPSDENMDLWVDCLNTIFQKNAELIAYVQKICGLICVGKVFVEGMIIAYGDGRNGKSTFWNTIFRVMGSYAKTISAETLTTSCKRNVMPELASLKGCRMALASEMQEDLFLNTAVVKQLASTDPIHAEKKFYPPCDFEPTHTLILYTNYLPQIRAMDTGIWRRVLIVPFNARIEGKSDIKNYSDYLIEHAGGAVLKWMLEGAKIVVENNYQIETPAIVKEAIEEYQENNNWLSRFFEDRCEVSSDYTEGSGKIYTAYRAYCERSGELVKSTTAFYNALESRGYKRKKTKSGMVIHGLRLKQEV